MGRWYSRPRVRGGANVAATPARVRGGCPLVPRPPQRADSPARHAPNDSTCPGRWEENRMDTSAIHQAIGDLNRAFLADMEALPAETWQQPSDCAGWTIAGALIHLAQVAELLGDSLTRGRAGDPGPPPLAAQEGGQAWRARRAERQQEALKQSPSELLAWYRQAYAALDAELDAIPTADPSSRGWHPVGPQPLAWVQDQ